VANEEAATYRDHVREHYRKKHSGSDNSKEPVTAVSKGLLSIKMRREGSPRDPRLRDDRAEIHKCHTWIYLQAIRDEFISWVSNWIDGDPVEDCNKASLLFASACP
jgi:hypothetical protein